MNILQVIQCTNLGGMEQMALLRMNELIRRGHSCRLVSLNRIGALGPKLRESGIAHEGLAYRRPWGTFGISGMFRAMRRPVSDAILMTGHNLTAQSLMPMIKAKRKLLSLHFHHRGVKSHLAWKMVYATACRNFDAITFSSNFIRNEALAINRALEAKSTILPGIYVIPPLPSSEERRAHRRSLGLDDNDIAIGNAGWLVERKRFDVFLKVCALLKESHRNLSIAIAGDGPLRGELEEFADGLGLSGNIRWLGWRPDLLPFYSSLDLLLFNSEWDAVGRTPLEAISIGTPVVASVEHGGLKEMLPPQFADVLDHHEITRLAELCDQIIRNPQASRARAVLAREHLSKYSPESHCDRLEELLSCERV